MTRRSHALVTTLALVALAAGAVSAQAATNGEKCAAAKMKAAAKFASCRLAADAKAESSGEMADYTKCTETQAASWLKIEDKYSTDCLTSGDQASVQGDLTDATGCVSGLLAGAPGSCATTQDPPCPVDGEVVEGVCWLLGAADDTCSGACGAAGMLYDSATASYAGNPSNLGNCLYVAAKLGYPVGGSFGLGGPPDTGCAVQGSAPYLSTSVTANGNYSAFRRVCACH